MKSLGEAAQTLIANEIELHCGQIRGALNPLEPRGALLHWFDTLRAIEEFLNIPLFCVDDDVLTRRILSCPLHGVFSQEFLILRNDIADHLSENAARRFVMTMHQARALGEAYTQHSVEAATLFENVASVMTYFQSRRRHLVSILYTLPAACKGSRPIERMDTINLFAPLVEIHGLAITGLHSQAMLSDVFDDFSLETDDNGIRASHVFEPLDTCFLEPERASIVEMIENGASPPNDLEAQDSRLVFSPAECRNQIRMLKAAYAEFGLADSEFGQMASFLLRILDYSVSDYFISLDHAAFESIVQASEQNGFRWRAQIVADNAGDYVRNTNEFAPLIRCGDRYLSTVTLITRFLNYWKNVSLNKSRRFQVRSGFIFEETVRRNLTDQGFKVLEIRRIERKEFDVIAIDGDIIYNIQCKNNLVDLSRVESDRKRFARYNRYLNSYYGRALLKEEKRESLLRSRLSLQTIKHFVISRFPVATTNPRIMSYSKIGEFRARAAKA